MNAHLLFTFSLLTNIMNILNMSIFNGFAAAILNVFIIGIVGLWLKHYLDVKFTKLQRISNTSHQLWSDLFSKLQFLRANAYVLITESNSISLKEVYETAQIPIPTQVDQNNQPHPVINAWNIFQESIRSFIICAKGNEFFYSSISTDIDEVLDKSASFGQSWIECMVRGNQALSERDKENLLMNVNGEFSKINKSIEAVQIKVMKKLDSL